MFEIIEDLYLEEGLFLCPECGAENYYYFDEQVVFNTCITCAQNMHPRPSEMVKNRNYRVLYHFHGKELRKELNGKKKKKVYTSCYRPGH